MGKEPLVPAGWTGGFRGDLNLVPKTTNSQS
jgi:hypothetical protein